MAKKSLFFGFLPPLKQLLWVLTEFLVVLYGFVEVLKENSDFLAFFGPKWPKNEWVGPPITV